MEFESWIWYVDAYIARYWGVGHEDIADQPWRAWYDAGKAPVDAANEAMAAHKGLVIA